MSQDNLIKLQSEGTDDGKGTTHIIYSRKNKSIKQRLRLKKYNPLVRMHTWYKETK